MNSLPVLVLVGLAAVCAAQPDFREIQAAEAEMHDGRFADAQTRLQRVVAREPDNAKAWTYLGVCSLRLGKADLAVKAYERAIAIQPKDPRVTFDLALLYASGNQLDKAIDAYQKGLALDSTNSSALYNYGRLLIHKNRYDEAADAFRRAISTSGNDLESHIALTEVLLRLRRTEEARVEASNVLARNAVPVEALVSLAEVLVRGAELNLAGAVLNRALRIAPQSASVHVEMSRLFQARNDLKSAVDAGLRAVELAPDSLEANLSLSEAYITARRNAKAVEHLHSVENRFGSSAGFQYTLGIAQFRNNRYGEAIKSLKSAVELDPRMDMAHFLLGSASLAVGELDQAESSFARAAALNDKQPLYQNYLARVYEKKGPAFRGAAREKTEKALVLDSADVDARHRLAKWAMEDGDLARARSLLEAVVRDAPSFGPARVLLAKVYYRLDLRQQGREQEQVAKRLEAESQNRQQPPDPN